MNSADSYQQYECPQWFADKLKDIGGINKYEQANFICKWGQGGEPECLYRAGGIWDNPDASSYKGYRNLLVGSGCESWLLMQWDDAIVYGSPESYYAGN